MLISRRFQPYSVRVKLNLDQVDIGNFRGGTGTSTSLQDSERQDFRIQWSWGNGQDHLVFSMRDYDSPWSDVQCVVDELHRSFEPPPKQPLLTLCGKSKCGCVAPDLVKHHNPLHLRYAQPVYHSTLQFYA